jgi:hypothetical protein
MSDIDPEKLEEALAYYGEGKRGADKLEVIFTAARAHLATLPRWKEVEVERWTGIDSDGTVLCVAFHSEAELLEYAISNWHDVVTPVRLTGTAKVRA